MADRVVVASQRSPDQRRGCIFRALGIWFAILTVLLIVMMIVTRMASSDPDRVTNELSQWVDFTIPSDFYPYRSSQFMGVEVYSFWSTKDPTSDGRATAVIAFNYDDHWEGLTPVEVEARIVPELENMLKRNEFETRASDSKTFNTGEGPVVIHRYSGLQRIEKQIVEANACYRFIRSPKGVMQVQTMGVSTTFPLSEQVSFLQSLRPKNSDRH